MICVGFLPFALCILPSLFSCLLLPTVCRLRSHQQSLLQNLFLRFLDRHAVMLAVLINRTVGQHIVPMPAQDVDLVESVSRLWGTGRNGAGRFVILCARLLFDVGGETRRALQTRLW